MITAKIIADSIANKIRLVTMELNYPRFIHSEFMTHRMFSRNASSSRAIPVEKVLEQVRNYPAMPTHWGKNQPGMQAREEIFFRKEAAKAQWEELAKIASEGAEFLHSDFNLHKQIVNRVLEPFQWIKVIVTATEWDNFFKLRDHPDAQPEIAFLAAEMRRAMEESTPAELEPGEWHLPYTGWNRNKYSKGGDEISIKCSVARCARVSYNNHDNSNPDIAKDINLADKLLASGHMSPFEHVATPIRQDSFNVHAEAGITHIDRYDNLWSGNLRGWIQYRQLLTN